MTETQYRTLPQGQQAVVDRLVAVCQDDSRVVAAWLTGSYARGSADAYSDLDLCLITTDEAYEAFLAERGAFIRRLGEPLFLEEFDRPGLTFFILADGTEGELATGREGDRRYLHTGPYRTLLDKTGVLAGGTLPWPAVATSEQLETLRRLVFWFWHDLSHFITATARSQYWWASGQLEILRRMCVDLLRLRHDFSAEAAGYDKVELAVPVDQLAPLRATYCLMEPGAMLEAVRVIVDVYHQLAPPLAQAHGIPYPVRLERLMCDRLATVCVAPAT